MQLQYSKGGILPSIVSIEQDFLRNTVARLSFPRVYGTPENVVAEAMVADHFQDILGSVFLVGETRNICSGDPEATRILIGAHYDSVPDSPGADDNASAVAVLLAVARWIGRRTDVMYVAFNAEECGLIGSREFVEQMNHRMKLLEKVHILEMLGYRDRRPLSQRNPLPMLQMPTTGDFLGIVANQSSLIDHIIQQAERVRIPVVGLAMPDGMSVAAIRQVSPHLLRSDHVCFWEKNIPAVLWTDTSEFRNPHYHQPGDSPESLDYEFMAEVAELLASVVQEDSLTDQASRIL